MCSNGVQAKLEKNPFLCNGTKIEEPSLADSVVDQVLPDGVVDCSRLVGFEAVYRVCFGMTCFYWLFMILMVNVKS